MNHSFPLPSVLRALVAMGDFTPRQRAIVEEDCAKAGPLISSEGVALVRSIPELETPDGWGIMAALDLLGFLASVGSLAPVLAGFPAPSVISLGEDGATVTLPHGETATVDFGGRWHGSGIHYAPSPQCGGLFAAWDAGSAGVAAFVLAIRGALTPSQLAGVAQQSRFLGDCWAGWEEVAIALVGDPDADDETRSNGHRVNDERHLALVVEAVDSL